MSDIKQVYITYLIGHRAHGEGEGRGEASSVNTLTLPSFWVRNIFRKWD